MYPPVPPYLGRAREGLVAKDDSRCQDRMPSRVRGDSSVPQYGGIYGEEFFHNAVSLSICGYVWV